MIIRKELHVILDLTITEVAMLKDLIKKDIGQNALFLGDACEQFRLDLLFNLPSEDTYAR